MSGKSSSRSDGIRVAIVTQTLDRGDGQGRICFEIARAAARRGWNVTALTSKIGPELRDLPNVNWVFVPWSRQFTTLAAELAFARRTARWISRHRSELDVVHVNGFNTFAPGDLNASHTVHSSWIKSPTHTARIHRGPYGAYQWLYTYMNTHLERWAYGKARLVIPTSRRIQQELLDIGVLADRMRVILNGVDLEEFRPGEEDRAALGLPAAVALGLFVGDIRTPRKNLDTVLKAVAKVPAVHLAVVGKLDGSPYPQMATQMGIEDRVHFLGFRRDVASLMRAADSFVFPSRYEACSLVLLEALGSGLPVITAETAGGAEIITPECGVVLQDPNDVAGIAEALQMLVNDPQRRKQMGIAARQIAECYSWDRMADQYLQVYEELACRR
jgi:glycosyltransferase involved in cell wall biosynthesis